MKQKVVGVVGGMGPFATISFFQKLVELTPAKKDWEHLHIIIDNNVKIPSRTRAILYKEKSPVDGIVKSIKGLQQMGVEVIALPCNSAHYFLDDILLKINIPLLNLIEMTSKSVIRQGFKRPLIVGGYITTQIKLYSKYLPEAVYPEGKWAKTVTNIIEEIKVSPTDPGDGKHARFFNLVHYYQDRIDSVVLACTELSLIYLFSYTPMKKISIYDSTLEYAKAVVNYALGEKLYD